MPQGPTNVNLIATYIYNNPGCRRVDLKRMLHKAATGEHTDKRSDLWCKNQYFQRWGTHNNIYLDRLWYNSKDKDEKYKNRWGVKVSINTTRESSYYLTSEGLNKVWPEPMLRPFTEGVLVECQNNSPNHRKRGWYPTTMGLVVERTPLYGLWILPVGKNLNDSNKLLYISHQMFVREFKK